MKLYNIALNNLRRRKAKMAFLVLGLVIAVSTVVVLVTLSKAMNADLATKLDEFGANIIITPKSDGIELFYGGLTLSDVAFDVKPLGDKDAQLIRTIKNRENISIVAPKLLNVGTIKERKVLVVGVDFDQEVRLKKWWSIIGNRPNGSEEALIGAEVKNKLQLGLNQTIQVSGSTFSVRGILEPTGSQDDGIVFIPLPQAQKLFGKPNQLSVIEVAALCYDCPIEEIVRQISEKLADANVMAIKQTIESKMQAIHRFEHFSFGISVVVLIVGALIVFTNMTASVNERRREIGVFRAIGFRQSSIMKIILTEAMLTSSVAGLLGFFAGYVTSRGVLPFLGMEIASALPLDPIMALFAWILAVALGVAASVYPAYKASRLDPTIALKSL
jgi:putative ABC transport system permease protein